jgi:hypothetical protein
VPERRALFFKGIVNVKAGVRKGKTVKAHTRVQADGKPLEGHPYHGKSDDELRYLLKDAGEAAKLHDEMHGTSKPNKYADQVNDAATVLHYRKSKQPPAFHVTREEGGDQYIDSTHTHFAAAKDRMMHVHKEDEDAAPLVHSMPHGILAFPHTETGKATVTPAYKRAAAAAPPAHKEHWADA